MNKGKWKHGRKAALGVLVLCLIMVTILGNIVQAEEGEALPVEVSTWDELSAALEHASNGDVIKIMDYITIPATSTIGSNEKHITLQKGQAGGVISFEWSSDINQTSHVQNIVFDGAKIIGGGTMISANSSVEFYNCEFINCYSDSSSGALYITSTSEAVLNRCVFDNNKGNSGGHIMAGGKLKMNDCVMKNGVASVRGGAVYMNMYDADFVNCIITENEAVFNGGGIANTGSGTLTLQNTKIYGNHAEYGNDVYTNSGFQMDATLETLQALYADEEITVNGWKSTSIMDRGNEFFGMYLDYEVKQVPPETDEPIGGGSGGVVEQDPPKTETPTDQSGTGQNGNQQTPSDSNAGNTSTSSSSSTTSSNISNVTNTDSSSTDTGDHSDHSVYTSTTDNSDRSDQSDNSDHSSYSTVTNNDNSDRSTVTNNHYASALQLSDQGQQPTNTVDDSIQTDSNPVNDVTSSAETKEIGQVQESGVQPMGNITPNIKIDVKGVDCVMDYNESGGCNVSITSDQGASDAADTEKNTLPLVDAAQIVLLAAIFICLVWNHKNVKA